MLSVYKMRLNRMGEGTEVVNTLRKVHSQQALSIALSVTLHTVISLSSSLLLGQY